ncbi:MAG: Redoxin [Pseudomonadota bacterium]
MWTAMIALAFASPSQPLAPETLSRWWSDTAAGPRLVTFWSVTCSDCREELPTLATWTRRHLAGHVVLVQLDVAERRGALTDAVLAPWGDPPWTRMHLDVERPSEAAAAAVPGWARAVPTHVLFDATGAEVGRWVETLPPLRRLRQALAAPGR